jgi:hypothetical protein
MNVATIYVHPEDKGLSFDSKNGALTAWNEGNRVSLPIGPMGLAEAGRALLALAAELTANEAGGRA